MRVRWTADGLSELKRVTRFLARNNRKAAMDMNHRIRAATKNLEAHS